MVDTTPDDIKFDAGLDFFDLDSFDDMDPTSLSDPFRPYRPGLRRNSEATAHTNTDSTFGTSTSSEGEELFTDLLARPLDAIESNVPIPN